jgi:hypothetical protein
MPGDASQSGKHFLREIKIILGKDSLLCVIGMAGGNAKTVSRMN